MTVRMLEKDLQRAVINLAHVYGYRVVHFRTALSQSGRWMTAQSGDVGFPDVVMTGRGRCLFVELKQDGQYLKPEQKAWRDALLEAGAEWYLWRPADLASIPDVLSRRAA